MNPGSARTSSLSYANSRLIMRSGFAFARALVALGRHNLNVRGGEEFADVVCSRTNGLITVSNHISVLDDPTMWASLPKRCANDPLDLRWVLAAEDICFTNRLYKKFFLLGQTLPVKRFGAGPFQPAIDAAIRGIQDDNNWFHVFPEGFVRQEADYEMRYFKWGVSRLILETKISPTVVPIFISGFDKMMHEKRPFPRFFPRPKKDLLVHFGNTICPNEVETFRTHWRCLQTLANSLKPSERSDFLQNGSEARELRSRLARFLRAKVCDLRLMNGFPPETEVAKPAIEKRPFI